ncbi:restriction endonuclease subunit S [Ligilactobacillus salivarius]|uniref:restriction endonuclease subunit S n=1 Tax=Ligilactobacillus salivarius TaxID=1624 RepID=UPI003397A397
MAKSFFYDIWERKKLGNVAENLSYGLNLPSTNYDGNNIYLRITDIDDESHTLNRDHLTSPNLGKFDKNILDYKLTENDVVFARTGASVGKTYVYTPTDGDIYFAGFLVRAKFKSSILANFVFYTTLTSKYLNYVKVTSQRSGQPGVNAKEYGNFAISITDSTEQFRIISLLKKLDGTINLHERKCEELALIKKALLQKLFPKKDEFKPEVRYKNFSDAWEQRKLGEVASYRNGKAHEKDINESGKYIVINSKFVSSNGTVRKYSNKMIAPLNKGEISFVLSDVPNGKALARTFLIDQDDTYTLNQRIAGILPKQEVDPYFMSTLMNRNSYFLRFDDGVGQTNLSKRDVTEWNTFYPSHAEQKKIGGFLQQLDSLITLHQRKLEKLKQLKKFLLQNMLI